MRISVTDDLFSSPLLTRRSRSKDKGERRSSIGPPQKAAPQYVHFNYCQSNLSTPPHPGSLSTRYGLSSFKRNLLRTSKAPGRQTSVPELTAEKIKLHDRARYTHEPLLKVWRTRVSRCHSSTAGTSAALHVKPVHHV